ncbi:hypothetical protein, partial [Xylella fastidiosa]|uniref:hypothetical protein n=1 Tax=Xylella fastidiosa TaxID=2371 RepID=UPI000AD1E8E6
IKKTEVNPNNLKNSTNLCDSKVKEGNSTIFEKMVNKILPQNTKNFMANVCEGLKDEGVCYMGEPSRRRFD